MYYLIKCCGTFKVVINRSASATLGSASPTDESCSAVVDTVLSFEEVLSAIDQGPKELSTVKTVTSSNPGRAVLENIFNIIALLLLVTAGVNNRVHTHFFVEIQVKLSVFPIQILFRLSKLSQQQLLDATTQLIRIKIPFYSSNTSVSNQPTEPLQYHKLSQ